MLKRIWVSVEPQRDNTTCQILTTPTTWWIFHFYVSDFLFHQQQKNHNKTAYVVTGAVKKKE